MFDNFKSSQFIAYSLLKNAVDGGKLSHAYLIDGNNNDDAFDFVMAFVKFIVCGNSYTNNSLCGSCNICSRIDDGNYPEVKIVENDSLVIKKEQLLDLQRDFSLTAVEGKYRIYVIKDCDKMNKQSSNSLLKFLEEPDDNIIAILFTNNINNVLSTIISRCQLIKLVKSNNVLSSNSLLNFASSFCDNKRDVDKFIEDESKKKIIEDVMNFILFYEKNGLDTIIYLKKMWYNNFQMREDSIFAMFLIVNFYYDVLKYKYGFDDYFFKDYMDNIESVSVINSMNSILYKIELSSKKYDDLRCNLNVNLLIDDLVIRLGECDE